MGLGEHFRVGNNVWYVIAGRASSGILKVRHGVVLEVGIADLTLTRSWYVARVFLGSFN